jgi:hypothetical protein
MFMLEGRTSTVLAHCMQLRGSFWTFLQESAVAPGSALDGEAHSRETVHALNLLHQDYTVTQYFTRN